MSVVIRGVKNALRNKTRTIAVCLVLAVAIGLTLSMLIANRAVAAKLESLRDNLDTTVTVMPIFEMPKPGDDAESETEPDLTLLTDEQLAAIEDLDHVASVTGTLDGVLEPPERESEEKTTGSDGGPAITLGGPGGISGDTDLESPVDAEEMGAPKGMTFPIPLTGTTGDTDSQGKPYRITEGEQLSDGDERGALVSDQVAEKNDLDVGDTFTAFGEEFTVVGIAKTGEFDDVGVVMLASTVRDLADEKGYTGLSVEVDDPADVPTVVDAISEELGKAFDVKSQSDSTVQAVSGLESVERISWIGFLVSLAGAAVVVFFTLTMTVRERRREVGVLKAIGGTNRGVISQFVAEALTLVVLATVVGLGLAAASSNAIADVLVATNTPAESKDGQSGGVMMTAPMGSDGPQEPESAAELIGDIAAGIGGDTLGLGLLAALAIAVAGSAIPAYLIARVRPAEVLRGE